MKYFTTSLCVLSLSLLFFGLVIIACDEEKDGRGSNITGTCGDDMVLVQADPDLGVMNDFCMDRYEASRADATADNQGSDSSIAQSKAGVIPWNVYPMSTAVLETFRSACEAAGKRLCTQDEWFSVCTGTERNNYVWGDTFDPLICNCVDSFCADLCLAEGIPESECDTDTGCGYYYFYEGYTVFHVVPTGQFAGCVSGGGVYDLCGNVCEVVLSTEDARGYEIRGGAFNDASAFLRLKCSFNANWQDLYAGFRCCSDAE